MAYVSSIDISRDNKYIISGHFDGSINLWDAKYYQFQKTLRSNLFLF